MFQDSVGVGQSNMTSLGLEGPQLPVPTPETFHLHPNDFNKTVCCPAISLFIIYLFTSRIMPAFQGLKMFAIFLITLLWITFLVYLYRFIQLTVLKNEAGTLLTIDLNNSIFGAASWFLLMYFMAVYKIWGLQEVKAFSLTMTTIVIITTMIWIASLPLIRPEKINGPCVCGECRCGCRRIWNWMSEADCVPVIEDPARGENTDVDELGGFSPIVMFMMMIVVSVQSLIAK